MKNPTITKRDAMHIKKKHCVCITAQPGFSIGVNYHMKIISEPEAYIVLTDDNGKERRFKNLFGLFTTGKEPKVLKAGMTTALSLL